MRCDRRWRTPYDMNNNQPIQQPLTAAAPGEIDLVKSVFEHRLHQADLDRILTALSGTDRDELLGKLGEFLHTVSALLEVANSVADSLDLDVLLPRLMEVISGAMNADRSTLFLYDTDTAELYSRVAQGDSVGEIRFPANQGIAGSVFNDGQGLIIPDAYQDSRFNQEVDRRTGYRTRDILCAPVRNKGRVVGVAQVLNKNSGEFNADDLNMLEALAAQAAAALENAQLMERVERARREEARLLEVTNAIASELRLDTLLGKIVYAAAEMLEADRGSLFLYDADTQELWSKVAEGMEEKEIRFPAWAGIAGSCFSSGEIINIPDAYADDRFNQEVDRKTGYRTRNMLCVPVVNKEGQKLAVIQVLNKIHGPFLPNDERRLQAFGAQVAVALENARLFREVLNERNYNESILRSLSTGVVTLDAERRLVKANEAVLRFMGWSLEEILETPVKALFQAARNRWLIEALESVIATGEVEIVVDAELEVGTDATISVNASVVPLIDISESSIGYMMILEDISAEKRLKSTMSRYMTKEVADKLLESGADALGGTAQEASVLFSDIRRFTTLSEQLGPRDTVAMLNEYFTEMVEVIFAHSGILDKYIGDAIMALFGAPFATDRDADNALTVANLMISRLRVFNRQRRQQGKAEIEIGVGISTGELIAGNIGSPKRMDYTVIGDTVNLAARLEGATKYYGVPILFCEDTDRALVNGTQRRAVDLIRVKGRHKPVSVYEALDHHDEASFPNMAQALERFAHGLSLYHQREWQRAAETFAAVLNLAPGDGPGRLYLERCRHYAEAPPGDDWDGVWTMTGK